MKAALKRTPRHKIGRRARPLSLTMRVERLEKEFLFKKFSPGTQVGASRPRFINLDANGKPTNGDHVAVYQTETGLIWTAAPLRDGAQLTHADAVQAATEVRLLGQTTWRSPAIRELLSIVDYELCDPAVDTAHFKGPYGWTWASTVAKVPATFAWFVYLHYGGSARFHRGYRGLALAVLAGQQLGLGL